MKTISLQGLWSAVQVGHADPVPATVPGCIHTALLAAGRIELTSADFRPDDNFVHLRPGEAVTLTVTPSTPLTHKQFEAQLILRSLVDLSRDRQRFDRTMRIYPPDRMRRDRPVSLAMCLAAVELLREERDEP